MATLVYSCNMRDGVNARGFVLMLDTKRVSDYDRINAVEWKDGRVCLLDQRLLPGEERYVNYETCAAVALAISNMVVRGAPAIGIAAAYGVVLAAMEAYGQSHAGWRTEIRPMLEDLTRARPTAVNLHWAIERMSALFDNIQGDPVPILLAEAISIHDEDRNGNFRMGETGAGIINGAVGMLTHCNAGALATGGYGTALGVIRSVHRNFGLKTVYVCETRPWLQGTRLTAWELAQDGISTTLITDSSAAFLMAAGKIDWVIVGADRIAANGDTANKIGTYSHALAARHHGLKFMVAAPTATIDPATPTGADIPIEERSADEFYLFSDRVMVPKDTNIFSPVFDITPAHLIDVLVTEKGAIYKPNHEKISAVFTSDHALN